MDNTLIGTVSTLYPLKVQLVPEDTELPVVATSSLAGIKLGSRILIQKFGKLLIGTSVISDDVFTRCMLQKDAVQSIPNGAVTKVTFSSSDVQYDPMSMFNDANDSIVIQYAGWYDITLGSRYLSDSSNGRLFYVYNNGAAVTGITSGEDGAGRWGGLFTVKLELAVDDYLQFYAYQASGSSLNLGGSSPLNTFFSVIKI